MELRIYLQMLWRSWWVIALTALAALAIALIAAVLVTPQYQANATFLVSPNASLINQDDVVNSMEALDKRSIVATYAEVLNSDRIYSDAVAALGLNTADLEDDYSRTAVVLPEANILELTVEGPNSEIVAALVNSIGSQAIEHVMRLYSVYDFTFLDPANVPSIPIRPQPVRDSILAVGLGVILGAVLAIIREQMRVPLETFLQRTSQDDDSQAFTRAYVEARLDEAVTRTPDAVMSLGLVHLEGLDGYLDVMPQPVVQRILRQITQTMRQELWGTDIIGRWDKTTYSVFMRETTGTSAVSTLGRVQLSLSKPVRYTPDGETLNMRPKIGVAQRSPGDPVPLVIERAEQALKQASHKDTGLHFFKVQPF
ncbi:MAG: diguanylate cyclase [Chloroflexi bacterium]|nr:diguanylate cyclase [Chloroflexota bacterium]